MIIYLIGLTTEEAQASIDYLKESQVCGWQKNCPHPAKASLFFRHPGKNPITNAAALVVCAEHRQELKSMIHMVNKTSSHKEASNWNTENNSLASIWSLPPIRLYRCVYPMEPTPETGLGISYWTKDALLKHLRCLIKCKKP
jgi:hypothetical protein